jgi:DNA modification methylase
VGEEGNLLALHPTVKPAALVGDAIMDCTDRREVVLDAFLGSGTTAIAAERTGRRCYGLELDPRYVDTIVRRWQTFPAVPRPTPRLVDRSQKLRWGGEDGIP